MTFKKILMRYHISPLTYENGEQLEEKDYTDLFKILQKYFAIKQITENSDIPQVNKELLNRVIKTQEKSLIPFEPEELMDILMQKKGDTNL